MSGLLFLSLAFTAFLLPCLLSSLDLKGIEFAAREKRRRRQEELVRELEEIIEEYKARIDRE